MARAQGKQKKRRRMDLDLQAFGDLSDSGEDAMAGPPRTGRPSAGAGSSASRPSRSRELQPQANVVDLADSSDEGGDGAPRAGNHGNGSDSDSSGLPEWEGLPASTRRLMASSSSEQEDTDDASAFTAPTCAPAARREPLPLPLTVSQQQSANNCRQLEETTVDARARVGAAKREARAAAKAQRATARATAAERKRQERREVAQANGRYAKEVRPRLVVCLGLYVGRMTASH